LQAALPGAYTFTSTDAGIRTFSAALKTAGIHSITGKDTVSSSITGTQLGIVVVAAGADHLVFAQGPSNAIAGSAIAPPVTVQLKDAFGNNVPASGITVTISLNSGTGTLSGTTSRNTGASGLATFDDLSINLIGTKTLKASAVGLLDAISASFVISATTASQFVFIQQPTSTVVGATIIPAITVQLKDSFGNSVATPGVSVTITINSGGGSLGGTATRLTDASGLATFNNLNINTSGTKTLKAASGTLTPAISNPFDINPANTSTTVSSSVNPSVFGQPVIFTATVSAAPPGSGTPAGTVTFTIDGTPQAPATLNAAGQATLTTTTLSVGLHTISTAYSGDGNYNSSGGALVAGQTVNRANTSTALVSPINPACSGDTITFTVTVTAVSPGAGVPTGTVRFRDGGIDIGTGTLNAARQATLATSSLSLGTHSITATYEADPNFNLSPASAPVNQVINTTPTITSQPPASPTVCANTSVSLSVSATGGGLTYQWRKNGVSLTSGGNIFGASTATLTINPVSLTDSATYDVIVSNGCGSPATSSPSTLTVNPLPDATITSNPEYCPSSTGNIASVPGGGANAGATFLWTVVGGTLTSPNNQPGITYTAPASGTVTLTVQITTTFGCTGSGTKTINPTGGSSLTMETWPNKIPHWEGTSTLSESTHFYNEGNTIPFRIVVNNQCAGSTWEVKLDYFFYKENGSGTDFAYYFDFLTTYNLGEPTVNGFECFNQTCVGSPTTTPIPSDPSLPPGTQLPGVFTVYNGSITSVSGYSLIVGSHQQHKSITIRGTGGSGASDVVILVGLHMASLVNWGAGNGAADLPGGATGDVVANLTGANIDKINVNVNPTPAPPTFQILDNSVCEGDNGVLNTILPVRVSIIPVNNDISVTYTVTGGSATSGTDYQPIASGTLTFPRGTTQLTQNIIIPVIGDTTVEPNETVEVTLSNPTGGATFTDYLGVLTILDDDCLIAGTITTSPNPPTFCVSGSATLTLNGYAPVSAIIQWQSSTASSGPFSDIPGATGPNYTTPTLTSTTYYRARITDPGCLNSCAP
ncbi:MAG: hypothetical protein DME26_22990, partial [Verrucomicrobia bacterium]